MKNLPPVLYLNIQLAAGYEGIPEDFTELQEVTHSQDAIDASDPMYVRSDLIHPVNLIRELYSIVDELRSGKKGNSASFLLAATYLALSPLEQGDLVPGHLNEIGRAIGFVNSEGQIRQSLWQVVRNTLAERGIIEIVNVPGQIQKRIKVNVSHPAVSAIREAVPTF